jgi:beta-glucosidase
VLIVHSDHFRNSIFPGGMTISNKLHKIYSKKMSIQLSCSFGFLVFVLSFLELNAEDESAYLLKEPFLWGVSTAAYQIEGAVKADGRKDSIWDAFASQSGKIANNENANIADDSYYRYSEDISLLKNLGVNAYRFSLSWPRIIPTGRGNVNEKAIIHYNKLIDEIVAANIEPVVTLYHWDLPQALEDQYDGLLSSQFESDFVAYADVCFKQFGDRVKKWITINEPWTIALMGYGLGKFAPGRCSDRNQCLHGNSSTESYLVAHNLLNSHAAVVDHYRSHYQQTQVGVIGITLNHDWAEPFDTSNIDDIAAAQRRNEFGFGWFADPLFFGHYPVSMQEAIGDRLPTFTLSQQQRLVKSLDFLGFNHYTTKYYRDCNEVIVTVTDTTNATASKHSVKWGGWVDDQCTIDSKYNKNGHFVGPQGESG